MSPLRASGVVKSQPGEAHYLIAVLSAFIRQYDRIYCVIEDTFLPAC